MNDRLPEKNTPVDRRVARTRAGLQHALVALIVEKGYDAITIEDICKQANVGRSTFYLHYANKDALKRGGLEHLRDELVKRRTSVLENPCGTQDSFLGFSLALFEHASSHIDLYRALAGGRGAGVSLEGIRKILSELVRADLARTRSGESQDVPSEFVIQYVVGACMSVLTWWLDHGAKLSPQRMDAMFRQLTSDGIAGHKR